MDKAYLWVPTADTESLHDREYGNNPIHLSADIMSHAPEEHDDFDGLVVEFATDNPWKDIDNKANYDDIYTLTRIKQLRYDGYDSVFYKSNVCDDASGSQRVCLFYPDKQITNLSPIDSATLMKTKRVTSGSQISTHGNVLVSVGKTVGRSKVGDQVRGMELTYSSGDKHDTYQASRLVGLDENVGDLLKKEAAIKHKESVSLLEMAKFSGRDETIPYSKLHSDTVRSVDSLVTYDMDYSATLAAELTRERDVALLRGVGIPVTSEYYTAAKHPIQRIEHTKDGLVRFKPNKIVQSLVTTICNSDSGISLDILSKLGDANDMSQLLQLTGSGIDSWSESNFVDTVDVANGDLEVRLMEGAHDLPREESIHGISGKMEFELGAVPIDAPALIAKVVEMCGMYRLYMQNGKYNLEWCDSSFNGPCSRSLDSGDNPVFYLGGLSLEIAKGGIFLAGIGDDANPYRLVEIEWDAVVSNINKNNPDRLSKHVQYNFSLSKLLSCRYSFTKSGDNFYSTCLDIVRFMRAREYLLKEVEAGNKDIGIGMGKVIAAGVTRKDTRLKKRIKDLGHLGPNNPVKAALTLILKSKVHVNNEFIELDDEILTYRHPTVLVEESIKSIKSKG